jgi:hypothetical protein
VAAKLETEFVSELAMALHEDGINKTLALIEIRNIVDGAGRPAEKVERIQDVFANLSSPL